MSKSWDKGILKKLKSLKDRGLSAAEIGKRLGLSKNAIVGKMHRMGWNPKATEDGKSEKDVVKEKTGVKTKPVKVVTKKVAAKKNVTEKKPVAKKVVAKKVAPKKNEKKLQKPVPKAVIKKPLKSDPNIKKPVAEKAKSKPIDTKKVKQVTTPESKPEPKQAAVGRPIAGRGGAAHQRIVQHALEMANLKPNQCRWPIGDPDSDNFHFCGNTVFVGKPYCYEHCKMAYQFAPPKKK